MQFYCLDISVIFIHIMVFAVISAKKGHWNFHRNCTESLDCFGNYCHLTINKLTKKVFQSVNTRFLSIFLDLLSSAVEF